MAVEYYPVADDITGRAVSLPPGLFVLNPANQKFVYGQSQRIGSSRTMFIIGAIIFLIAAAIYISTAGIADKLRQIETHGNKVEGVIIDDRANRGRRSTSYYVTYRYEVDDISYSLEQQVNSSSYQRLNVGDSVVIRYLPEDPLESALSGEDRDYKVLSENEFIAFVVVVVAGLILLALFYFDRRNRTFSRKGRLVPGEITEVKGRNGSKGAYTVTVNYRFRTPTGEILDKKSSADRRDLRNNLPAYGTPVMVLYVNNKMQRLM